MTAGVVRQCRARRAGLRCQRERGHDGYHKVDISSAQSVEWSSLLRLGMQAITGRNRG